MCSNLYYPFHSDPKGLSEIQDDQQEFYNLFRSSKHSLAKGLTFGNTNSSTTIIDTFGLLVFRFPEEIFWVTDNLSLPSTFLWEFVKVASYDLVFTMASLYTSPPLSRFLVTTQKLPVKGHRQLQLAQDNFLSRFLTTAQKLPLNGHSWCLLVRNLAWGHCLLSKNNPGDKPLVEFKNSMVWLPGYSLVEMQTAQISFTTNFLSTKDIINSNLDIAFISENFLRKFHHPPRIVQGQWIRLVQVTVNTTISGCLFENLHFPTDEGMVKINVETYVVKGMNTPFNLGNYFANQYSLMVILRDSEGQLEFSNYEKRIQVEISTSFPFADKDGLTFWIGYLQTILSIAFEQSTYRKAQLEFRNYGRRLQVDIRKSGWRWYDRVEFICAEQTGRHFSDIIQEYKMIWACISLVTAEQRIEFCWLSAQPL
jgi:hypothetical protein